MGGMSSRPIGLWCCLIGLGCGATDPQADPADTGVAPGASGSSGVVTTGAGGSASPGSGGAGESSGVVTSGAGGSGSPGSGGAGTGGNTGGGGTGGNTGGSGGAPEAGVVSDAAGDGLQPVPGPDAAQSPCTGTA